MTGISVQKLKSSRFIQWIHVQTGVSPSAFLFSLPIRHEGIRPRGRRERTGSVWSVCVNKERDGVRAVPPVILLQIVSKSLDSSSKKSCVPVQNQWVPVKKLRVRNWKCLGLYVTRQLIWRQTPKPKGTQRQFLENICSEDNLRSGIFGTFVVKLIACLPLLGFSNI